MYSSDDLAQLDLSSILPSDDLVAYIRANERNNSNHNVSADQSLDFANLNLSVRDQIALAIFQRNGPVREDLSTLLSLTIVYSLILFTGVIGNICTCIVIVKNKYLHTSVNYYLFSLACSDLLLLILGLPQEMWVSLSFPAMLSQ